MKLLVLGGTKFLGRAVADAALAGGHELTLFNRGETSPELYPEAERLHGDRDGDLAALEGGSWDAVVDTSGYVPRVVRASAELLRDRAAHYVFVSSVSAYATPFVAGFDESAPLHEEDPPDEDVEAHYAELKAACERVLADVLPGQSVSVRAGLIVGPHDPTGRFTYWPHRIARGGRVLCPAPPDRPWQWIDVRDLGAWLVELAERRVPGAFTATGAPAPAAEVLEACRSVTGSDAELVWADEDFLLEREVGTWMELPLWLPASDSEFSGMLEADPGLALEAGLAPRPVEDTVRGALTAETRPGAGLTPEREAELLVAWDARSPAGRTGAR